MKTRLLIILGIIISITILASSLIIIDNIEAQSKFPPLRDDLNAPDELRVILQLCEKPWEDRGLNQEYRNQTHHLDTHNCVWKYNFDKIDWSNSPTNFFEETSLRLVLHGCSSWIESKNGREPLTYSNETHFINTKNCEWESISEKTVTGSYELEDPLCMGGRGMIKNEHCERIGKYDFTTGMPIVENNEQCDMLKGDWDEKQKICDSKYGVENRK